MIESQPIGFGYRAIGNAPSKVAGVIAPIVTAVTNFAISEILT